MTEHQRLLIAVFLSFLIVFAWQYFFVEPIQQEQHAEQLEEHISDIAAIDTDSETIGRDELILNNPRVHFETKSVKGSINLQGARIDDLTLSEFHTSVENTSKQVTLFSPSQAVDAYFAEFGWVSSDKKLQLPNNTTLWKANKIAFKAGEEIELSWRNDANIEFIISITLDEQYMFSIKQRVVNHSPHPIKLKEYALLNRSQASQEEQNMIIHEGVISVLNGKLGEITFADLLSQKKQTFKDANGWVGFSDKFWLAALISNKKISADFVGMDNKGSSKYQVDIMNSEIKIEPSKQHDSNIKMFAGAKKLELLDYYEKKYNIPLFDRAVDFGVLYFITKPIFLLLSYFYKLLGNFGVAILLLTVLIKLLLLPLAYKGYKGMNRLKEMQPRMQVLREKFKDDTAAFQKNLMEMYKKEGVNPLAGCLPLLLQMPVFFALYKVLYVSIEMRHAPFFGWIKDLSAPDPLTITNLFGLIDWTPPTLLHIGVFPILMAVTMYLQQRMHPEPSDPVQAKVMRFLPVMFLFMFSSFPVGLLIYWAWSNVLSIIQQLLINLYNKQAPKRKQ